MIVTSPAAVSFTVPVMSESTIGEFFGMSGFWRGPVIATVPVCAPPTETWPVGCTVLGCRST